MPQTPPTGNPSGGAPPMPTGPVTPTQPPPPTASYPYDPAVPPKTVVNWIPTALPPKIEKTYLVWVSQGGSILKGIFDTGTYLVATDKWITCSLLEEGDRVDLWADVLPPFFYEAPPPGGPPISPQPPA